MDDFDKKIDINTEIEPIINEELNTKEELSDSKEIPSGKERFKNILKTTLIVILAAFLGLLVRVNCLEIVQVNGLSMYPTLNHNDKLMLNKMSNSYDRGDIVVLIGKETTHRENDIIKRIIGVAGDKIEFKSNKLYLNDKLLEEDYVPQGEHYYEDKVILVPEDSVYVLGDNRDNSQDSRFFGPVSIKNIKGKIFS